MKEYPRITELLDNCARWPDWRKYNKDLATELRALLAERDALKAKAQPVRKLREYKGIVYDPGCEKWRDGPVHFNRAVDVVACRHPLTDADHAAIYALREQPYETVREDRQVIRDELPPVLPADAVAAEGVHDV